MKPILLALVLISALAFPLRGSDDPLSAQELAHHLGATSWISKMKLQGNDWVLQILHVVNGKAVNHVLGSPAFATDREFTRVVILASQTSAGTQLSIEIPGAPAARRRIADLPLKVTIPLPPTLSEGDYVLGGEIPLEAISKDQPAANVKDLQNGLVLRVTKRP
ncbi:MAG TPA: hypothetical protein VNQ90_04570 [Chthoniobacteraceae bacterium]|nr:hypothetical protein [Chthoniobacteraceae bacterium]